MEGGVKGDSEGFGLSHREDGAANYQARDGCRWRRGFGRVPWSSVLDVLVLRCPLDLHVEMAGRQLGP